MLFVIITVLGFLIWDVDLTPETDLKTYMKRDTTPFLIPDENIIDMAIIDSDGKDVQNDISSDVLVPTLSSSASSNQMPAIVIDTEIELLIPRFFSRVMRQHQISGAVTLYKMLLNRNGAILGDMMGLGKAATIYHYFLLVL